MAKGFRTILTGNGNILFFCLFLLLPALGSLSLADEAVAARTNFNFRIEVPPGQAVVNAGDELLVNIQVINLGSSAREDVILEYSVTRADKNKDGSAIISSRETVAVETQANFVRGFRIPPGTESGKYTLHAKIMYSNGGSASAKHTFSVKGAFPRMAVYALAGMCLLLGASIIIYLKARPAMEVVEIRKQVRRIVGLRMNKEERPAKK